MCLLLTVPYDVNVASVTFVYSIQKVFGVIISGASLEKHNSNRFIIYKASVAFKININFSNNIGMIIKFVNPIVTMEWKPSEVTKLTKDY